MKYAVVPKPPSNARTVQRDTTAQGGWWVQFGDTHLIYAAQAKWREVSAAIGRGEMAADGDIRKGDMHLVVQKGRTFQQAHPDIPVILDKGRYLVVDVPKAQAKRLAHGDAVCFAVTPLAENSVAFAHADPAPIVARAGATELVAAVREATFTAHITHLVRYPTRFSTSAGFREAADWAEGQLSALGYATRQDAVDVPGFGTSANVVARRAGLGPDPQQVIVVAHLDSVNHPGGPEAPAPGADDNASGSAGLLALAEAMAPASFAHDITFVLFGGEEQGLHGSKQFVAAMDAADKARTTAVLNMDMIGARNTPAPTVLLEGAALSQALIDSLATSAAQFTGLAVQTALEPFASDHVPFIEAGIPAVLTIEGADGANDAIHTENDTLDRVDVSFAMEILRMNAGFLAEQAAIQLDASPDIGPDTGPDCGCAPDLAPEVQTLAAHYQMLIAQYTRLHARGLLQPHDIAHLHALHAQHHHLTQGAPHG